MRLFFYAQQHFIDNIRNQEYIDEIDKGKIANEMRPELIEAIESQVKRWENTSNLYVYYFVIY